MEEGLLLQIGKHFLSIVDKFKLSENKYLLRFTKWDLLDFYPVKFCIEYDIEKDNEKKIGKTHQ